MKIAITGCCELEKREEVQANLNILMKTLLERGYQVETLALPINLKREGLILKQIMGLKSIPFDEYYDLLICCDLFSTFLTHHKRIFYLSGSMHSFFDRCAENKIFIPLIKDSLQKHLSSSSIYTDSVEHIAFFDEEFGCNLTYLPQNNIDQAFQMEMNI